MIIVHRVQKVDDILDSPSGSIKQFLKQGIIIQCGNGSISILSLQPENKKVMDYKTFMNGHLWRVKDRLTGVPTE